MNKDEFVNKFDSKIDFTEQELKNIVYEDEDDISIYAKTENDSGRWHSYMTAIIKVDDRYFSVDWQQGLTEDQDDNFHSQFKEVYRHEYEKVVKVEEFFTLKELQEKGIILND